MTSYWLIEYTGLDMPCYLKQDNDSWGITFRPELATQYPSKEEAQEGIKFYELKSSWMAMEHKNV
jgi:hypothetical protein